MAGDGGGDAGADLVEVQGLLFTGDLIEQFVEHVLDGGCVDPGGRDFNGDAAGAEGLGFEAVVFEFAGDLGKDCLLRGREFEHDGHEQALAFHFLRRALLQDAFEEHALVGDVLVDDPEAVFVYGEDERIAYLAEGTEGGERGQSGIFADVFIFCSSGIESGGAAVVGDCVQNCVWNRAGEAAFESAGDGDGGVGFDCDSAFELEVRGDWRGDRGGAERNRWGDRSLRAAGLLRRRRGQRRAPTLLRLG
jgi:hypothetical protein